MTSRISTRFLPSLPGRRDVPLTVLYDADCGFCTGCALLLRRVDRAQRLRLAPLQEADLLGAPIEEELRVALHVVDADERWEKGGAALLRIAASVPVLRPLAWAGRLPLVPKAVEGLYQLVADNRHRLSRLFGLESCDYRGARH